VTDCLTICEKLLVSYDLDINELLAGAKRTALQVGWSQGGLGWDGIGAENKIEHNSLIFLS